LNIFFQFPEELLDFTNININFPESLEVTFQINGKSFQVTFKDLNSQQVIDSYNKLSEMFDAINNFYNVLTPIQKNVLNSLNGIVISDNQASNINLSNGVFTINSGDFERNSSARQLSDIFHDAFHYYQYVTGQFDNTSSLSAAILEERQAIEFQLSVAGILGLSSYEIGHLQNLPDNHLSYRIFTNSYQSDPSLWPNHFGPVPSRPFGYSG